MYNKLLFLASCMVLIAVSHGQCNWNEELVECVNECNTCGQRTVCVTDCNPGCDCIPGYYRNWYGVCIPERFCGPAGYGEEFEVAEGGGCPNNRLCANSCRRRGRRGGHCTGRRRRNCRCF